MSSPLPLRTQVSLDERDPRLVDIDDERADDVFDTLSSETTRAIFLELHSDPQTVSDLASATGTSVQNVQYHVEKLTDAGLVEVVDIWYSERGTEMSVYAPRDGALVLVAGDEDNVSLRQVLERLVGAIGVLVPASAVVTWLTARQTATTAVTPSAGADGPSLAVERGGAGTVDTVAGLDPAVAAGLAFFLGGLFVFLAVTVWTWSRHGPSGIR